MAIQMRRGQSTDFNPSKLVPGEWAVSQDNQKVYMCFNSGQVVEIGSVIDGHGYIRYSEYADGTDFVSVPTSDTIYIGFYMGSATSAPSDKTEYTWSKYVGDKGDTGDPGNKWYSGLGISGKSSTATVYSGSGVTLAYPNDFYLNPSEGAIYHCVTGGNASTATWVYDFTMTGGGGGGTYNYNDLSNKPSIENVTLSGALSLSDIGGVASSDLATVATSGLYSDITGTPEIPTVNNGTLTIQKNGVTVTTFTANQSSNATANITTDSWTEEISLSQGDISATFAGLNTNYSYVPFIQCADNVAPPKKDSVIFNGTSCTVTFTAVTAAQAAGNMCKIKLRILK